MLTIGFLSSIFCLTRFYTISIILALVSHVFLLINMWKLLKRSGKPGWFCLIPFYNDFITLKIVGMRYRALIVFAIPILYIIPTILFYWRLTLISKRGTAFFFGLVFLSIIFLPILAFSPVKEK